MHELVSKNGREFLENGFKGLPKPAGAEHDQFCAGARLDSRESNDISILRLIKWGLLLKTFCMLFVSTC